MSEITLREILEDPQRGTERVWARCRCGFEIRDNDLERFDGLCPKCKLDWYIKGFDGLKDIIWETPS